MLSLSSSRASDFRFRPRMLGIDLEVRAELDTLLVPSMRHPEVLDEVSPAVLAVEVRLSPEVSCWNGTDEVVLLREAILTTGG